MRNKKIEAEHLIGRQVLGSASVPAHKQKAVQVCCAIYRTAGAFAAIRRIAIG
jgi:hypothetical protein